VVDAHVEKRSTPGIVLLDEWRASVPIYIGAAESAVTYRAGMIDLARPSMIDQQSGSPALPGEQGVKLEGKLQS
jgi:hypothetical protein